MAMHITFDLAKDAANRAKHGVSLALANELEWENAYISEDDRRDYKEIRMVALVMIDARLYVAVFTVRDGVRRMISLRKANDREVRTYVSQN
jgi:uncharacterized protein